MQSINRNLASLRLCAFAPLRLIFSRVVWVAMNRKEFGKLIAALREEQIDFSARGVGVWTQSKLAQAANLSEKTVSNLNRGAR